MGLSSQFKMSDLARLARSSNPMHRDELLLALGALNALHPLENAVTEAAVSEIMLVLYPRARADVRSTLSTKLCEIAWAAHPLIMQIARDIPEIARPVIIKSPVLVEGDLVELIAAMGSEHRLLIADRPEIGETVTTALASHDETPVLVTLIENRSARLSMESFATCVRVSRRNEDLRARLTLRPDMPRSLIPSLFAYSGEAERLQIAERFQIDAQHLSSVVKEAIDGRSRQPDQTANSKQEESARQLVEKLARSDHLTASFVIKVLNDRKFILFEHALARLAGVGVSQLRKALKRNPLQSLALGCRAARIDRSIFLAIHSSMQASGRDIAPLSSDDGKKAATVFGNHSPAAAAVALRLIGRAA